MLANYIKEPASYINAYEHGLLCHEFQLYRRICYYCPGASNPEKYG